MKKPGLVIALAIVVLSNAFVLVHAWSNRRGTPDAEVVLTQRELSVISNWTETSSIVLILDWRHWNYVNQDSGSTAWFTEEKLRQLGFDVQIPANAPDARRLYANQPPRQVYVALEYNGPAWDRWWANYVASQTKTTPGAPARLDDRLRNVEATMTRLMEIDAGLDPAALRRAHPNRQQVIILPARARVLVSTIESSVAGQAGVAELRGEISDISTDRLVVPPSLSGVFASRPTSYSVTVAVGSRSEPWITAASK